MAWESKLRANIYSLNERSGASVKTESGTGDFAPTKPNQTITREDFAPTKG